MISFNNFTHKTRYPLRGPHIVMAVELLLFMAWYFFGATGLRADIHLRGENQALETAIHNLQQDIRSLEKSLEDWERFSFYKEKYAREQLHMGFKGDMVYTKNKVG